MGDSQGRAPGLNLGSGDAYGLARGQFPAPVLVRGLARGHAPDRGQSRAIGEIDTESTLADLVAEVGPRVTAAVGNAKDGEREVARRMYVFFFFVYLYSRSYLVVLHRGRKEKGGKMGWRRPLL
jgi:hypothetical protein